MIFKNIPNIKWKKIFSQKMCNVHDTITILPLVLGKGGIDSTQEI